MNNSEKKACYKITISNKFENMTRAKKNMKNIHQILKRIAESDDSFEKVSFIVAISDTDSSDAKVSYIKGKKGRPKRIVKGTKVEWHLHIYVTTTDDRFMSTFCNIARTRLRKRGYITEIRTHDNLEVALNYVSKQALYRFTYGPYFKSH